MSSLIIAGNNFASKERNGCSNYIWENTKLNQCLFTDDIVLIRDNLEEAKKVLQKL